MDNKSIRGNFTQKYDLFLFYWEIAGIHHCVSLKHRAWWFDLHAVCNDYHSRGS